MEGEPEQKSKMLNHPPELFEIVEKKKEMNAELNVKHRLILLQLLIGAHSDIKTIRAVKKLREELVLSPEEIEHLEFKNVSEHNFSWDVEKDIPVSFEIDPLVL